MARDARQDHTANVQIADVIRASSVWHPGIVRVTDHAITFAVRGDDRSGDASLSREDIVEVSLAAHRIGPDEILVTTRGAAWAIRVSDGAVLVEEIRAMRERA